MPHCVAFDLDDTLFLERDYVRSGFEAVGRWARVNVGIGDFAERAREAFERGERGAIFDRVLEARGIAPERALILRMLAVYRTHLPRISLCADAAACIVRLRGHAALAIVTDGPLDSQRAKVRALGVEAWARPVVYTAALGADAGKPSPKAFELVETLTGVRANLCVYVADNPAKDFAGPKNRGWRTVRVRRPEGLHAAVPDGDDVDAELEGLDGLERVLAPAAAEGRP